MKLFSLKHSMLLPISIDEAWQFFSNPQNLPRITPPSLRFTITSAPEEYMYPGQIITYRVHPLLGIPMTWVSEITQVEEKRFFVDEQRYGPYRIWHHQHRFTAVDGGVRADDIVHYMMPFGPLGLIMQATVVSRQLQKIFDYRAEVIRELFGELCSAPRSL